MTQPRVLREYRRRLQQVATRYNSIIAPDNGFGLTESQGTSIVNTCEALIVLRAAVKHQLTVDRATVERALNYLTRNLSLHCAPRTPQGGRGRKARFVSFALSGLSAWPDHLGRDGVEAIAWGLDWYADHSVDGGIPEEAGVKDASLFQNAIAISALCKVMSLPIDSVYVERAAELARDLVKDSLYFALPTCTWPRQAYSGRTSPAKTALMLTALNEAHALDLVPEQVDFSGASERARLPFRQFTANTSAWLLGHVGDWTDLIEADPDVTGTQWHHLAYALCLQSLASAGAPLSPQVAGPWRTLFGLWDQARTSWCEPTKPKLATVRADYVAVQAFEALLARYGTEGADQLQALIDSPPGKEDSWVVTVLPLGKVVLEREEDSARYPLELSPALESFLTTLILLRGQDSGMYFTAQRIAEEYDCRESSVGQFVKRLNSAVKEQTKADLPLIASQRAQGYQLNAQAVRYMNT